MKWEYRVDRFSELFSSRELEDYFNSLGSAHWELVQYIPGDGEMDKAIFKRPSPLTSGGAS